MSNESSSFRIDWSPSPVLRLCLGSLTVLACISIWLGNWAMPAKLAAMPVVIGYGAWLVRREASRLPFMMQLSADGATALLGSAGRQLALTELRIHVRGPIASAIGLAPGGRVVRVFWPPDVMDAPLRRRLRLAAGTRVLPDDPTIATLSG